MAFATPDIVGLEREPHFFSSLLVPGRFTLAAIRERSELEAPRHKAEASQQSKKAGHCSVQREAPRHKAGASPRRSAAPGRSRKRIFVATLGDS
jgi:hypothetical protein